MSTGSYLLQEGAKGGGLLVLLPRRQFNSRVDLFWEKIRTSPRYWRSVVE